MTEPGAAIVHTIPINDLVEHDTSVETGEECLCGPKIEPVRRPDGSYGWLVGHHSLDGREAME